MNFGMGAMKTRYDIATLTAKDFAKYPTEIEPTDPKLDVEIISQKITLSNEFIKNMELEN